MYKYGINQSNSGRQSYASKLKIIFFLLAAVALLGCAKNNGLKEKNNIGSQNSTSARVSDAQNKKAVKILFVGDMMFDRYIREAANKKGYGYIFEGVRDLLAGQDLVVGNLEGPITNKNSVSVGTAMDEKKNLDFSFDPAVAKTLADDNIKLVNLGNNHVLNQGQEGVTETENYLSEAGVGYFGDTGDGKQEFSIRSLGGTRIAFVNYNYSVSGSFEKAIKDIGVAKNKSDVVIVCPHWGTEYKVGNPGPAIRNLAHQFIDAGADLIIGTHPHVIEDSETYQGKKIYYSLGNFIFDQYFQKETTEGLGVEVTISPDRSMEYNDLKFKMTTGGQTKIEL
jgi:poly-gamma-glutamate capsule biosynthesis protein CapA/YwtB (metallophosphatase superfamily)